MATITVCDELDYSDLRTEMLEVDTLSELKSALRHRGWAKASLHRVNYFPMEPFFSDEVVVAHRPIEDLTEHDFEELALPPVRSADLRSGTYLLAVCAARLAIDRG
jgi:hypothetical protein